MRQRLTQPEILAVAIQSEPGQCSNAGKITFISLPQLSFWRFGEDDDAFRMELVTRDDWQSQSCYSDLMMHMMTIRMSPLCWPPWPLRITDRDGHTQTLGIWGMTGQWPLTILSSMSLLVNTFTVILVSLWWWPSSNNSFSENIRSWEQIFRMTLWSFELGMNKILSLNKLRFFVFMHYAYAQIKSVLNVNHRGKVECLPSDSYLSV